MPSWSGSAPVVGPGQIMSDITTVDFTLFGLDNAHRAGQSSLFQTTAPNTTQLPIAVNGAIVPGPGVGKITLGIGEEIFEKIHVLPPNKRYPFILSTLVVPVEVWNAYRKLQQQVDSVIELGPAGVSIATPYILPIIFPPLQSKVFDVLVTPNGASLADNTIQWNFAGLEEPIFRLTGLRQLPFTISPDWDHGIDDEVEYATAVTTSSDDTEQRMLLRNIANRTLAYVAKALEERENGLLMALLHSWQARSYGVLLWMDSSPLLVNVLSGEDTISVDTTSMGLVVGDTVILIFDAFTWFASPVAAVTSVDIQLDTPLDQNFFAGLTRVIPVKLGRVASSVPVERPTNKSASVSIKFDLEVVKT